MDEEIITTESEETEVEDFEFGADEAEEDGWKDIDWSNVSEEADEPNDSDSAEDDSGDADQPAEESEPEAEGKEQAKTEPADVSENEEKAEDADQYLELKHLDEVRKVNKEQAKELAQKGLDYDRVRSERDTMKSDYQTLKSYEAFLNELKGDFPSIEALMNDTRARLLSDKEGISYADAMAKVQNAKPATQKAAPNKATEGNDAVQKFVEKYPHVKAEEIPQSVWDEVRETGDLVSAYGKYENSKKDDEIASLRKEIEVLKQNSKNERRSAGSSGSSGKTGAKSMIQSMWEADDY